MSKRKIGSVKWSMMFKIDTCKRTHDEMWEILHKFDREVPSALCEWAADNWYTWHSFSTLKSLERALPLVFEAFPETKEISVYKDVERGNYANGFFRKTVTREVKV